MMLVTSSPSTNTLTCSLEEVLSFLKSLPKPLRPIDFHIKDREVKAVYQNEVSRGIAYMILCMNLKQEGKKETLRIEKNQFAEFIPRSEEFGIDYIPKSCFCISLRAS